jgi:type I restriction enzyme S subunit
MEMIMTKNKAVPVLRFREFEGEWNMNRLNEITNIYDGTHQTPKYVEKGIPFYSVEHLTANQFSSTKFISEEVFEKENKRVKLEKGDILMTRIGSIGISKFINWDVKASFYVSLALIKRNISFNGEFLNQFICSILFQKELWKRTIHVAFPQKINLGEIGKCLIFHPSLPEQQKIATFLTAIDNKIQQLTKKKSLLEAYKKGVMQQIFKQEIRFRDEEGKEFEEWEEKQLKETTSYVDYRGKTPTKSEDGIFLVTAKNIKMGFIDYEYSKEYISEDIYEDAMRRGKPKMGDVLLTTEAPMGNVAIVNREDIALAQRVIKFRGKDKILLNSFLKHVFLSAFFQKKLDRNSSGSTAKGIKGSVLHKLTIFLPSIKEQQKIANFLTSIDLKIEQLNTNLEQTKNFKKGLLQKMFV